MSITNRRHSLVSRWLPGILLLLSLGLGLQLRASWYNPPPTSPPPPPPPPPCTCNCCCLPPPPPPPPPPPSGVGGPGAGGSGSCTSCGGGSGGTGAGAGKTSDGTGFEDNHSFYLKIVCGISGAEDVPDGFFIIEAQAPSIVLFSPQGLNYSHPLNTYLRGITTTGLPEGIASEVTLSKPDAEWLAFRFATGSATGLPQGNDAVYGTRLRMTDGSGTPVTQNPVYYEWLPGDGAVYKYDAGTGLLVTFTTAQGRTVAMSSPGVGIEIVRDPDLLLRQVKTPQSLADIVVLSEHKYDIRFYSLADVGTKDGNGYYTVTGDPFVTWTIENPAQDAGKLDQIKVTRTIDAATDVHDFEYIEASDEWRLTSGTGDEQTVKITRRAWDAGHENKLITTEVRNSADAVVSKAQETVHVYAWGELVTKRVEDPDGAALTSEWQVYTDAGQPGKYMRRKAVQYYDGSWEMYDYDSDGRMTVAVTPWKDLAWDDVKELSVAAAAALGTATYYDYTPVDANDTAIANDRRARTETRKIQDVVVGKTYHAYKTVDGEPIEIVERCANQTAAYGAAGNLRTTTTYYASIAAAAAAGRIKTVDHPDGRKDSYSYAYGTYTSDPDPALSSFTPGTGNAFRQTITHGTSAAPDGVAYKSTRETKVLDAQGNDVLDEVYAYDGTAYARIDWTVTLYDEHGRPTDVYRSNGTHAETTWACCGKDSETTAEGIQYTYTYDSLHRVSTVTKKGYNGTSDIVTTYAYDAAGHALSTTVTAGSLSLASSATFDIAGWVSSSTDQAGLVTGYAYTDGGRTTTVTRPGGATEITTNYHDRQMKSVTGTAIVAQYLDRGVNTDGSEWAKTSTGSAELAMWQKTTTDFLGRLVKAEKPAYDASTALSESFYDSAGRLVRTTQPGQAATLYEYDGLGNLVRSGLDVSANGTLDLASNDRISDTETVYEKDGSDHWWQKTTATTYATSNDSTATVTGIQKRRLSGFSGGVVDETRSADNHGNETVSNTAINRATRTVTRTVDLPTSTTDAVTVVVNGLQTSSTSQTGITTTFAYDALGRRTGVTDPRTGTSVTHYNSKGQVDYVEDAASNRTSYTYEPTTGRRSSVTDAAGHTSYTSYTSYGLVSRTWGDTPYPLEYVYDSTYARLTQLKTFRGGAGWSGPDWPTEPGTADVTTWTYQESTGLLTAKTYADSHGTTYTYDTAGRLATRTWARIVGGNALVTTYSYSSTTGEMTGVDYSDATPDVTFTYTRLGQQATVTDATGSRTFAYTTTLELDTEALDETFYSSKILTRKYQTTGTGEVPGRDGGFQIGTDADPDADYDATYAYGTTGRFSSVSASVPSVLSFSYSYLTNSDLLATTTYPSDITVTRAYESQRDLIDYIENKVGATTVSKYDYTNDAIGRRGVREQSGTAFTAADTITYGYNTRSEVTSADATTDPNYLFTYAYDPIGNRQTSTNDGNPTVTYTPNALNQYTAITGLTNPAYDLDGNMTLMPSSAGDWTLTWDGENRLVRAEHIVGAPASSRALVFVYDYMSRRIAKLTYTSTDAGATWVLASHTKFLYGAWNVALGLDALNANATLKTFTWGLDLSQTLQGAGGVGGLLAVTDSTGTCFATFDANGNVSEYLAASDSSVAAHYEFDPFGGTTLATGAKAADFPHRFSTKYLDMETALYYYGVRFLDTETGRWVSRDPIGEVGGTNLAAYVLNQSPRLWDPLGTDTEARPYDWFEEWRKRYFLKPVPPVIPGEEITFPGLQPYPGEGGVQPLPGAPRPTPINPAPPPICNSPSGNLGDLLYDSITSLPCTAFDKCGNLIVGNRLIIKYRICTRFLKRPCYWETDTYRGPCE